MKIDMKWKLIGQYLTAVIGTIYLVVVGLILLNFINSFYFHIEKQQWEKEEFYSPAISPSFFTDGFGKHIQWIDANIVIADAYLNNLQSYHIWVQVLDEKGTEIYSKFKPDTFPTHYIPGDLVQYSTQSGSYKGATLCTSVVKRGDRTFTYILGFPSSIYDRYTFSIQPNTIMSDAFKIFAIVVLVFLLVTTLIGYFFSVRLVRPILKVIEGIKALAKGDYSRKYPENGIYQEVNQHLNALSFSLKANEKERKKIEQMREEWISNITHDLKTPLASIQGYAELLEDPEYALSPEERVKYAGVILNKAQYLRNLAEDLKLTYQLENGMIPLNKKEDNLVEILRETIITILNDPNYQDIKLDYTPEVEEIPFSCNSLLMQRAFTNIIFNAIVHNPKGTLIKVSIVRQQDGIEICIEDNGVGIEKKDVERLFDRYYRGTNTGENHKGSGLGLAIAKQIIEAHGGSIQVESQPGKGTVMAIYF